jgi:hypothetical protein
VNKVLRVSPSVELSTVPGERELKVSSDSIFEDLKNEASLWRKLFGKAVN